MKGHAQSDDHYWKKHNSKLQIRCCKNCDKREIGCHSSCREYLAEKERVKELKETMKQEKELYDSIKSVSYDSFERNHKRKRRSQ